jgi:isoleucyl-tRNA synthetase
LFSALTPVVWLLLLLLVLAQVGLKYGLPLLSPVDDAGCFTAEAGPRFEGLQVQGEGNSAVVEALSDAGVLLKAEQYAHKYPYDWRTKKPTIFRATSQWFASVEGFRWGGQECKWGSGIDRGGQNGGTIHAARPCTVPETP